MRLAYVDHAPDLRAHALGEGVVLGTRVPPFRVTTTAGQDIRSLVSGTAQTTSSGSWEKPGSGAVSAAASQWPVGAMVRLEVFDAQGRRVELLANRYFPAGEHAAPWSPSSSGQRLEPGLCFYRIEAGPFHDRKKMTLLSPATHRPRLAVLLSPSRIRA